MAESHPTQGGYARPVVEYANAEASHTGGTATTSWSTAVDANPNRTKGVYIQNTNATLVELRVHCGDTASPSTWFVIQSAYKTPITQDNMSINFIPGTGAVQVSVGSGTCTYSVLEC